MPYHSTSTAEFRSHASCVTSFKQSSTADSGQILLPTADRNIPTSMLVQLPQASNITVQVQPTAGSAGATASHSSAAARPPTEVSSAAVGRHHVTQYSDGDEIPENIPKTGNDSDLLVKHTMKYIYEASDDQLANLDNSDLAEICKLCTLVFDNGELVRRLPCFHLFHTECVDDWLNKSGNCPICRLKIDDNNKFD